MPTLELEKLGLVDLSNNTEALAQTVGGGKYGEATLFYAAGTRRPYSTQETATIVQSVDHEGNKYVSVRGSLYGGQFASLKRNPGKDSYIGYMRGWTLRADRLLFNNNDHITVKTS